MEKLYNIEDIKSKITNNSINYIEITNGSGEYEFLKNIPEFIVMGFNAVITDIGTILFKKNNEYLDYGYSVDQIPTESIMIDEIKPNYSSLLKKYTKLNNPLNIRRLLVKNSQIIPDSIVKYSNRYLLKINCDYIDDIKCNSDGVFTLSAKKDSLNTLGFEYKQSFIIRSSANLISEITIKISETESILAEKIDDIFFVDLSNYNLDKVYMNFTLEGNGYLEVI